jgi:hypothetical protein
MGRHHGIEGFREFSNQRGNFVRGSGDMIDIFYLPYANVRWPRDFGQGDKLFPLERETGRYGQGDTEAVWG